MVPATRWCYVDCYRLTLNKHFVLIGLTSYNRREGLTDHENVTDTATGTHGRW